MKQQKKSMNKQTKKNTTSKTVNVKKVSAYNNQSTSHKKYKKSFTPVVKKKETFFEKLKKLFK